MLCAADNLNDDTQWKLNRGDTQSNTYEIDDACYMTDENTADEDTANEDTADEDTADEDTADEDTADEDTVDEDTADEDTADEDTVDEDTPDEDTADDDGKAAKGDGQRDNQINIDLKAELNYGFYLFIFCICIT